MNWLKSKTIWGAVIGGAAHALAAVGVITPEIAKTVEGVALALFGVGVRTAIAKNGTGE